MLDAGKLVSGCHEEDSRCTVKVPKNAPSSAYYVINVGITSDQGTGYSSDYYAVVGRGQAVITGKMLNKERQPVPGADIALFGSGHHAENYVAASGPDGVYTADVKAGRYRVWPSGRSLSHRTPPKFEPEHRDASAHAGSMAHANFTVDIGLVVKLTLSATTVPADGFQIVQGTVKVTELGRPQPGVTVALRPQASEAASAAVSRGAREARSMSRRTRMAVISSHSTSARCRARSRSPRGPATRTAPSSLTTRRTPATIRRWASRRSVRSRSTSSFPSTT
jgi:hypothetical protein